MAATKADHTEILEAALDALDEGIAVLDEESHVLFWNREATEVTGHQRADLLARPCPENLYQIELHGHESREATDGRPQAVLMRHHLGHTLPAMLRRTVLRNGLGERAGAMLRFHPMEEIDTLPRGEVREDDALEHPLERTQTELEERLDQAHRGWTQDGIPYGVLWIAVDQAAMLRKTHGQDACEAMLAVVERTLLYGLHPAETVGRWGDYEFLAICHEPTREMLTAHSHHLAKLVMAAEFRWWGDRVPLTVSIGAAQAEGERLSELLRQAQAAVWKSAQDGDHEIGSRR